MSQQACQEKSACERKFYFLCFVALAGATIDYEGIVGIGVGV